MCLRSTFTIKQSDGSIAMQSGLITIWLYSIQILSDCTRTHACTHTRTQSYILVSANYKPAPTALDYTS